MAASDAVGFFSRLVSNGLGGSDFFGIRVLSGRPLNHLKCLYCGGSGFPAAICATGGIAIRGWKAAPTIK
jgi:hypothetical protein